MTFFFRFCGVCLRVFFLEILRVRDFFRTVDLGAFTLPGFQWATEGLGWDPLLKT